MNKVSHLRVDKKSGVLKLTSQALPKGIEKQIVDAVLKVFYKPDINEITSLHNGDYWVNIRGLDEITTEEMQKLETLSSCKVSVKMGLYFLLIRFQVPESINTFNPSVRENDQAKED